MILGKSASKRVTKKLLYTLCRRFRPNAGPSEGGEQHQQLGPLNGPAGFHTLRVESTFMLVSLS